MNRTSKPRLIGSNAGRAEHGFRATLVFLAFLVALESSVWAQGQNVELVGQIGGACDALALQAQYAYVGRERSLAVVDVANPARSMVAGKAMLPGMVTETAVASGGAHLADYHRGWQLIDPRAPAYPVAGGVKPPVNLVHNGGFEAGIEGWQFASEGDSLPPPAGVGYELGNYDEDPDQEVQVYTGSYTSAGDFAHLHQTVSVADGFCHVRFRAKLHGQTDCVPFFGCSITMANIGIFLQDGNRSELASVYLFGDNLNLGPSGETFRYYYVPCDVWQDYDFDIPVLASSDDGPDFPPMDFDPADVRYITISLFACVTQTNQFGFFTLASNVWADDFEILVEGPGPTQPPQIVLLSPPPEGAMASGSYTIRWTDEDPDDDAHISLYYDTDNQDFDGTLIVADLSEDDETDAYEWDLFAIPPGTYWIYALIDDGHNPPVYAYSPGALHVRERTSVTIVSPAAGSSFPAGGNCVLQVYAQYNGEPLLGAEVNAAVTDGSSTWFYFGINDDGVHGDSLPDDGTYTLAVALPPYEGLYTLEATAFFDLPGETAFLSSPPVEIELLGSPGGILTVDGLVGHGPGQSVPVLSEVAIDAYVSSSTGEVPANIAVDVEVKRPDGSTTSFELSHSNGIVFSGQYTVTLPGQYVLLFKAVAPSESNLLPGYDEEHIYVIQGSLSLSIISPASQSYADVSTVPLDCTVQPSVPGTTVEVYERYGLVTYLSGPNATHDDPNPIHYLGSYSTLAGGPVRLEFRARHPDYGSATASVEFSIDTVFWESLYEYLVRIEHPPLVLDLDPHGEPRAFDGLSRPGTDTVAEQLHYLSEEFSRLTSDAERLHQEYSRAEIELLLKSVFFFFKVGRTASAPHKPVMKFQIPLIDWPGDNTFERGYEQVARVYAGQALWSDIARAVTRGEITDSLKWYVLGPVADKGLETAMRTGGIPIGADLGAAALEGVVGWEGGEYALAEALWSEGCSDIVKTLQDRLVTIRETLGTMFVRNEDLIIGHIEGVMDANATLLNAMFEDHYAFHHWMYRYDNPDLAALVWGAAGVTITLASIAFPGSWPLTIVSLGYRAVDIAESWNGLQELQQKYGLVLGELGRAHKATVQVGLNTLAALTEVNAAIPDPEHAPPARPYLADIRYDGTYLLCYGDRFEYENRTFQVVDYACSHLTVKNNPVPGDFVLRASWHDTPGTGAFYASSVLSESPVILDQCAYFHLEANESRDIYLVHYYDFNRGAHRYGSLEHLPDGKDVTFTFLAIDSSGQMLHAGSTTQYDVQIERRSTPIILSLLSEEQARNGGLTTSITTEENVEAMEHPLCVAVETTPHDRCFHTRLAVINPFLSSITYTLEQTSTEDVIFFDKETGKATAGGLEWRGGLSGGSQIIHEFDFVAQVASQERFTLPDAVLTIDNALGEPIRFVGGYPELQGLATLLAEFYAPVLFDGDSDVCGTFELLNLSQETIQVECEVTVSNSAGAEVQRQSIPVSLIPNSDVCAPMALALSASEPYHGVTAVVRENGMPILNRMLTIPTILPADVNGDGTVNAVDIQLVILEALDIATGYDCDINADGWINAVDIQLVINAALRL